MNDIEKYQFDLNGYLLVKSLLNADEVNGYLAAATALEAHVAENIDAEPRLVGFTGLSYRFDEKYQCSSYKNDAGGGLQFIVDDFLNSSDAFDSLVGHAATMKYVQELTAGPYWIGSSELRYRYRANHTRTHMGGRMDARNRYEFIGTKMVDSGGLASPVRDFNLLAVRVLYALHDIPVEHGPLCVVPGSHKSNFFSPFSDDQPMTEPGMIPIPMQAGDAIIFTENLRHGGYPNLIDRSRKTLHMMFAPRWAASQSPIHWDDKVYVSEEAWARYSDIQRALLPSPQSETSRYLSTLQNEANWLKIKIEQMHARTTALEAENEALKDQLNARGVKLGVVSALRKAIGI